MPYLAIFVAKRALRQVTGYRAMDWDCGFSTNSPEFLLLGDEEMEELRSEKTVTASKSPEEIQKLMVDERLSPINRAVLLLRTGQDVQKVYTVKQLPLLVENYKEEALRKVVPKICESLSSASTEILIAAGQSFATIVTRNLIPSHVFTTSLLPSITRFINSRDSAVSSSWLEALLVAVPSLSKDIIRREVFSLAVARAQLSQTVVSRKSSCLIFGTMAQKFEPFWLKRELFSQTRSLCQDVDHEVRATMCSQLHVLARHMGPDLAKSCVLPELTELASDEETSVRAAALETISEIIPHLPPEVVTSTLVPLMRKFCLQSLSSGSETLPCVARLLGKLSNQLKDVMTAELRDWFVQFYCKLSRFEKPVSEGRAPSSISVATPTTGNGMETECRRLCAYNFPAMLLLVGAPSFLPRLFPTLQFLANDNSPRVRHTVASGYHEVVLLLGDQSTSVAGIFQNLLRNKSIEVLQGLSTHLADTLKGFAAASNLSSDTMHPGLSEFIGPLLAAEGVASNGLQWRLHEEIVAGFSVLVYCLTSDQLYSKFVPLLFKIIAGKNVRPVKLASCHTLITIARHLRKSDQRTAICDRITEECAHSEDCRSRLLFLDICEMVLSVFSRAFFKQHFFKPTLELANDPVINVRLRVCSVLPTLKATLKLPGDRVLLQDLDGMVRQLLSRERDVDTVQAIRRAVLDLDCIQVAMESLTRRTFFEADLIDQQKEVEERKLQLAEEREREREKEKEGGKKAGSGGGAPAKSPVVQRALNKKLKAARTSSFPSPSPSSSHRSGSVPTLPPFSPSATHSPTHSPSTPRKTLAVPKQRVGGSSTPTASRVQQGHGAVSRCESADVAWSRGTEERGDEGRGERGEEGNPKMAPRSNPGSPRLSTHSSRPRTSGNTSRSANNSPSTGTKLSVTRSRDPARSNSSSKRKPPTSSVSKTNRKT